MKHKIKMGVIAIVIVGLVVGGYYYATHRGQSSEENSVELTEVQKVIAKDLNSNYPATPREVVKLYNRILQCFYNESYSEEELYELGDQARMLFDEELLDNNPRDDYFEALKADIDEYKNASKTIKSANVCDSNDIVYKTIDGDECAYVSTSYFINEDKQYDYTYQTYVLRKDDAGEWKILVFYQTQGDLDE